ncbi:response regulator transcription factor [Paraburkholderia phenazinium]|uniref:response regulator transcription factor n=1 Tax=Paraburkholderia phenazinium TaxID=60549 RepID=UPI00158A495C|nr:response regulator transcription factor [Paraburkholderia phenazinium]
MKIAVLEDEPAQADFVCQTLIAGGHECQSFSTGLGLRIELKKQTFDLLVLDWNIPDMSGEKILQWVRGSMPHRLAVLFLTCRGGDDDISSMLNMGADDYIVKPVAASVLLARVDSLLRRTYQIDSSVHQEIYGVYEFGLATQQVCMNGSSVRLTPKEYELALLFFRNMGRPLSRAYVFERVWKQTTQVSCRTMDAHISMIRNKLNLRPEHGYRLAPVYGYGYRLDFLRGEAP